MTTRQYQSEPALYATKKEGVFNLAFKSVKSEPAIASRKSHPLLNYQDDDKPQSYADLVLAAETLENIVNEGSFIGTIKARFKSSDSGREMNDHVLKLVYGTMKCSL